MRHTSDRFTAVARTRDAPGLIPLEWASSRLYAFWMPRNRCGPDSAAAPDHRRLAAMASKARHRSPRDDRDLPLKPPTTSAVHDKLYRALKSLQDTGDWLSACALIAARGPRGLGLRTHHFNALFVMAAREHRWNLMHRFEEHMVSVGVLPDNETMRIFMVASLSVGDWTNALQVYDDAKVLRPRSSRWLPADLDLLAMAIQAASLPKPACWQWTLREVQSAFFTAAQYSRVATQSATGSSFLDKYGVCVRAAIRMTYDELQYAHVVALHHLASAHVTLDESTVRRVSHAAAQSGAWVLALQLACGAVSMAAPEPMTMTLIRNAIASVATSSNCCRPLDVWHAARERGYVVSDPAILSTLSASALKLGHNAAVVNLLSLAGDSATAAMYADAMCAAEAEGDQVLQRQILAELLSKEPICLGATPVADLLRHAGDWRRTLETFGSIRNPDDLCLAIALTTMDGAERWREAARLFTDALQRRSTPRRERANKSTYWARSEGAPPVLFSSARDRPWTCLFDIVISAARRQTLVVLGFVELAKMQRVKLAPSSRATAMEAADASGNSAVALQLLRDADEHGVDGHTFAVLCLQAHRVVGLLADSTPAAALSTALGDIPEAAVAARMLLAHISLNHAAVHRSAVEFAELLAAAEYFGLWSAQQQQQSPMSWRLLDAVVLFLQRFSRRCPAAYGTPEWGSLMTVIDVAVASAGTGSTEKDLKILCAVSQVLRALATATLGGDSQRLVAAATGETFRKLLSLLAAVEPTASAAVSAAEALTQLHNATLHVAGVSAAPAELLRFINRVFDAVRCDPAARQVGAPPRDALQALCAIEHPLIAVHMYYAATVLRQHPAARVALAAGWGSIERIEPRLQLLALELLVRQEMRVRGDMATGHIVKALELSHRLSQRGDEALCIALLERRQRRQSASSSLAPQEKSPVCLTRRVELAAATAAGSGLVHHLVRVLQDCGSSPRRIVAALASVAPFHEAAFSVIRCGELDCGAGDLAEHYFIASCAAHWQRLTGQSELCPPDDATVMRLLQMNSVKICDVLRAQHTSAPPSLAAFVVLAALPYEVGQHFLSQSFEAAALPSVFAAVAAAVLSASWPQSPLSWWWMALRGRDDFLSGDGRLLVLVAAIKRVVRDGNSDLCGGLLRLLVEALPHDTKPLSTTHPDALIHADELKTDKVRAAALLEAWTVARFPVLPMCCLCIIVSVITEGAGAELSARDARECVVNAPQLFSDAVQIQLTSVVAQHASDAGAALVHHILQFVNVPRVGLDAAYRLAARLCIALKLWSQLSTLVDHCDSVVRDMLTTAERVVLMCRSHRRDELWRWLHSLLDPHGIASNSATVSPAVAHALLYLASTTSLDMDGAQTAANIILHFAPLMNVLASVAESHPSCVLPDDVLYRLRILRGKAKERGRESGLSMVRFVELLPLLLIASRFSGVATNETQEAFTDLFRHCCDTDDVELATKLLSTFVDAMPWLPRPVVAALVSALPLCRTARVSVSSASSVYVFLSFARCIVRVLAPCERPAAVPKVITMIAGAMFNAVLPEHRPRLAECIAEMVHSPIEGPLSDSIVTDYIASAFAAIRCGCYPDAFVDTLRMLSAVVASSQQNASSIASRLVFGFLVELPRSQQYRPKSGAFWDPLRHPVHQLLPNVGVAAKIRCAVAAAQNVSVVHMLHDDVQTFFKLNGSADLAKRNVGEGLYELLTRHAIGLGLEREDVRHVLAQVNIRIPENPPSRPLPAVSVLADWKTCLEMFAEARCVQQGTDGRHTAMAGHIARHAPPSVAIAALRVFSSRNSYRDGSTTPIVEFVSRYFEVHKADASLDVRAVKEPAWASATPVRRKLWCEALECAHIMQANALNTARRRINQYALVQCLRCAVGHWDACRALFFDVYLSQSYEKPDGVNAFLSIIRSAKVHGGRPEYLIPVAQAFVSHWPTLKYPANNIQVLCGAFLRATHDVETQSRVFEILTKGRPDLFSDVGALALPPVPKQ